MKALATALLVLVPSLAAAQEVLDAARLNSLFDGRRPIAAPSFSGGSAEGDLSGRRIYGSFSGRRAVAVPSLDNGFEAPSVGESSPAPRAVFRRQAAWTSFRDAFASAPDCSVLDRAYFRQPSAEEGVRMLGACLESLSQRYDARLSAMQGPIGSGPDAPAGILLVVDGPESALSAVRDALALRSGTLFGHPARAIGAPRSATGPMSSLQPVVERCRAAAARTAADFAAAYGACLRDSANAGILSVAADPTREGTVLVYTRDEAPADLSGFVEAGGARFSLLARRLPRD